MRMLMLVGLVVLLAACKPASDAGSPTPVTIQVPANIPPSAPVATAPAFVDKVWRVEKSSTVEAGTIYAFLADGTLVIDAPNGTPLYGSWHYADDKLTMTEEGATYPTDILKLDASTLEIRSNNPGGAVEIALVRVPDQPLPRAPAK
ncbi:hypothetical protein [Lysobacter sp. CFH 32150]|uniref:hypothetical protein n=1 Tax=Lysobacter sp. CFH 32150 TaxID=2927128 RepID=UPI001FA70484|nr:hypothetical protein [Lysobacter sp. CFH 32150]MCI4567532.1 hypothetical protein [Lysobacter sp. CFH 32150]